MNSAIEPNNYHQKLIINQINHWQPLNENNYLFQKLICQYQSKN